MGNGWTIFRCVFLDDAMRVSWSTLPSLPDFHHALGKVGAMLGHTHSGRSVCPQFVDSGHEEFLVGFACTQHFQLPAAFRARSWTAAQQSATACAATQGPDQAAGASHLEHAPGRFQADVGAPGFT